ncbi:hypothetical protein [Hymenobacter terricola]|uniref:hypothetical protein n=1 Tax=Hymenobacter terricola TaxID=2819236 RepID=UPI001B310384|nr:hypothetical protein [Hymenobacter terricola]
MSQAPPLLLFENTAGQLLADPAGFLRADWGPRSRTPADTRALLHGILRELQRRGWGRVLVNQVEMLPFSGPEQRWIAQEWLPQAVASGYRHGAVVISPNVLVRLSSAFVASHAQGLPLVYRSFENEDLALRWLLRQPASALG